MHPLIVLSNRVKLINDVLGSNYVNILESKPNVINEIRVSGYHMYY